MDTKAYFDYAVVDRIRAKERELVVALEKARESVKSLAVSVEQLRNERLHLEMVESD